MNYYLNLDAHNTGMWIWILVRTRYSFLDVLAYLDFKLSVIAVNSIQSVHSVQSAV